MLKTAIKPTSGYRALSFVDDIGSSSRKYFACFHFAEIELTEGEIREFVIDVNEGDYISEPITLEYLKPKSVCPNRTFQGQFNFTINATAKSTLPPILNAFEIYEVISLVFLPTYPEDGTFFNSLSLIIIIFL